MTILADHEIQSLISKGMVENHDPALINPASLDLRLGSTILIESVVSLEMIPYDIGRHTQENPYELVPGQFVLAETMERFNMPNHISGLFFLKSSRAREGYEHSHAGFADAGWNGSVLTLELKNNRQLQPLPLWPGLKIGQLVFHRMSSEPLLSYAAVGNYNSDLTVQASRGHL